MGWLATWSARDLNDVGEEHHLNRIQRPVDRAELCQAGGSADHRGDDAGDVLVR
jgi:hypothetical protein